ncbi:MAG: DUF4160 domain-containing protein [Leptolyngbyaceae cyanobacterium]
MPTVLRKDGFAFRTYFNDHIPPHIHAFKADGQAIISIGNEENQPKPLEVYEMSDKELKKALKVVTEH